MGFHRIQEHIETKTPFHGQKWPTHRPSEANLAYPAADPDYHVKREYFGRVLHKRFRNSSNCLGAPSVVRIIKLKTGLNHAAFLKNFRA